MFDKFADLKAIESGQATPSSAQSVKFWNYERDGNIMGTITNFEQKHSKYGEQHTVEVRLAESNELVSAFLNAYLQVGMERKQAAVGDLVLIQYLGKRPGERFNRYVLEIEKNYPEMF